MHQRQGIGRQLVADFECQVRLRGGYTIVVGTDDEMGITSLAGVDLYPNPLKHWVAIQNYRGHPYEFYQKVGFKIVGIIPDANGFGKPDILMSKRVATFIYCLSKLKAIHAREEISLSFDSPSID